MALGLAGCGMLTPCLDPSVCLSIAPPCSQPNPPPECDVGPCLTDTEVNVPVDCKATPDHPHCTVGPCLKPSLDDRQVAPDVCLSIAPPHIQLEIQCRENPEHPGCPPPEKVKAEVLEKKVLPEDVQKKLEEQE